jgi:hypothetical protein
MERELDLIITVVRPVFMPLGLKKIDVSGYPTDPKFLLPTLKILS